MKTKVPLRWIFLPGLDGTGLLFEEVLKQIPSGTEATVVRYPNNAQSDAATLIRLILGSLPSTEPYLLVAESFSGPLALRVVGLHKGNPVGLVLCSSFGRSPISSLTSLAMRVIGNSPLLHCRIPTWLIRRYLIGDGSEALVKPFRRAVAMLSKRAFSSRFKVLDEYTDSFVPRSLSSPLLYIRARQDRIVRGRDVEWLQKRFPSMKVHDVDSTHFVLQCQPTQAVDLIVEFLDDAQNEGKRDEPT